MKWLFVLAPILISLSASANTPNQVLHLTVGRVTLGGSGAVVQSPNTQNKYILTNWHVCNLAPAGTLVITEMETGEATGGKVVYKSPVYDLCLIRVEQRRLALPVGNSLKVGDALYSHGYPQGEFKVTDGQFLGEDVALLNVSGSLGKDDCPQGFESRYNIMHLLIGCFYPYPEGRTTLYAAGGSSGSPVVNASGHLVGVIQSATGGHKDAGIIPLWRILEFFKGY